MIKVDLNIPILDLEGAPIMDNGQLLTCGKQLSGPLATTTKGDSLKFYNWAQAFYAAKSVDLDNSDFKVLTDFVKNHESLTALVRAQILNALDECEKRK